MREMSARLLRERTGEGVEAWNRRIEAERFEDEKALRRWRTKQGVSGYAQALLVMERFGYPDFFLASAEVLISAQYADRPHLRPVFDAVIDAAAGLGEVTLQSRKTYVSLVSPRRTFAGCTSSRPSTHLRRISRTPAVWAGVSFGRASRPERGAGVRSACTVPQAHVGRCVLREPTTKTRLDLGLRLEKQKPVARLEPSKIHETMRLRIGLASPQDVDSEVLDSLQKAYDENS